MSSEYGLAVLNSTRATVTRIGHRSSTIYARRGDSGSEIAFQRTSTEAGHLTHGYALTFHKAQGMTATETFVLADDTLDRQRAYTGLSRGTHHNALYLADQLVQQLKLRTISGSKHPLSGIFRGAPAQQTLRTGDARSSR